MSSNLSVWCIGAARFVREISPLIDRHVRVRWIADCPTVERSLDSATDCRAAIVEHTADLAGLSVLELIKARSPRTRRLVVVDGCELKTIRTYLETEAANEILYRPLERLIMLKACGVTMPTVRPVVSHV